ncbi:polysaccharide deacetylase family protein [Fimbriimonas ginsengisoli]|uniref:Polysaccharide deacetylase n=1 Tax=Fimbriimonas ginsengisoli Gsoil 348 TaxID=661478 RepID=A0A068NXS6_FIMGI|nr:polysaccharide deacetylase family protein [Fimbriimonas ginsengisoli]AIE86449.1 Polysaccharide deacetylase [Fimbriimonas ginsengisoli Gsoil 348]
MAVPILMYHKVAPVDPRSTLKGHYVSPRLFEKQMSALASRGFTAIPLNSLLTGDIAPRSFVITFDDGYENFHRYALPILVRHGFQATVFLVANAIGGTNRWDSEAGDVEERLMTLEQIRDAGKQGTQFGSHTLDHADLPAIGEAEAWRQISESREVLGGLLGTDIEAFCYPYGRKNPAVREMVVRAGYRLACSTEKGANNRETDPFALRRINIRRDTSLPVFLYKLWRDARNDG